VPDPLRITDIRLLPGSLRDAASGLLGYVQFTLCDAVRVDGVTLRRTRDGRLALSYPRRRGREGCDYHYLRPVDDATRVVIEEQVLAQLDLEEPAP
jgi:DNA-binding cell septation regulator SpoVG